MQKLSDEEFHIGLAMAGAISAGAYSAGVVDFLIQALAAWEKARQDPELAEKIPNHRVGIKVMAGASAGSVTAAVATLALAAGLKPEPLPQLQPGKQTIKSVLPSLYEGWVVRPRMASVDGSRDFLATDDLITGPPVVSLLNSLVLDDIRDAALNVKPSGQLLPYISSTLDIYMALTNLHGVPYQVTMKGGDYGMLAHGDRAHYRVLGLGSWQSPSPFADADKRRDIGIGELGSHGGAPETWRSFADCALSSAAFPAGLAPRMLQAQWPEYEDRRWPLDDWTLQGNFKPAWTLYPAETRAGPFSFLTVDGGAIDNEPFEFVRFALMREPPHPDEEDGENVRHAIIMIDPFPEPPGVPPSGSGDRGVLTVLGSLLPALMNQARFKPAELVLAAREDIFSRYLVAPHRTSPGGKEETYAIASGLLGGFGGFLSRSFRDHDFQLGRRNCQKFMRSSFALPETNAVIQAWPQAARSNANFVAEADAGEPQCFVIIPLVGDAAAEVPYPEWPRLSAEDFEPLMQRIEGRADALAKVMIVEKGGARWKKFALGVVYWQYKSSLVEHLRLSILADLVRRDQIKGWELPTVWKLPPPVPAKPEAVRLILAELLKPNFDLRSTAGIAAATKLPEQLVMGVVAACAAETGKPYEVWRAPQKNKAGYPLYTLASRKASWFRRLPGIRQLGDWASTPATDPPYI